MRAGRYSPDTTLHFIKGVFLALQWLSPAGQSLGSRMGVEIWSRWQSEHPLQRIMSNKRSLNVWQGIPPVYKAGISYVLFFLIAIRREETHTWCSATNHTDFVGSHPWFCISYCSPPLKLPLFKLNSSIGIVQPAFTVSKLPERRILQWPGPP